MRAYKDRVDWIGRRIIENFPRCVDILDEKFVDDYIEGTGASFKPMMFGAHKCARFNEDLSRMFKDGWLDRSRVSISIGMGFPNWVYSYRLSKIAETYFGVSP